MVWSITSSVNLFRSYLQNRTQYVDYNEQLSDTITLCSGVPQGSILGPLLFSIYINDLPSVLSSSYHLYADDVQIYKSCKINEIYECVQSLNNELVKISEWVKNNRLTLNVRKSQAIVIFKKNINTSLFPCIIFDGESISYQDKVKNLGVIFNKTLSWDDHLNSISSKVHFILHGLHKYAYLTPERTRIKIVKSLILPYFLYVDIIVGCPNAVCSNKLNVILNACTRYVCNIRRRDHVSPYSSVILGCTLVN